MYSDEELLPISGHAASCVCPRQCALIHLERLWTENYLTASGRVMHEKTHSNKVEVRGNVRTVRGLVLRSQRLDYMELLMWSNSTEATPNLSE